jgi:hypothetical protein
MKRKPTTDTRDFQRSRVYLWEREVVGFDKNSLSMEECAALIARICKQFGHRVPIIGDGRGRRHAGAEAGVIYLPLWSRCPEIVAHEMAHVLVERSVRDRHGPLFMRTFIEILARILKFDRSFLVRSAREWGLRIASETEFREKIPRTVGERWSAHGRPNEFIFISLKDGSVIDLRKNRGRKQKTKPDR